jgi:hypothetical protein
MSMVLVAMGCVALIFSLLLMRRLRALRRLSGDLSTQVFDRTFSVFDPSMAGRKIISAHTGLVVFLAIYGSWFVVTVGVFMTFAVGGVLAAVTFLVCAGLLLVDETLELNRWAGVFVRAIGNGAGLGRGDLHALYLIRKELPRLMVYELLLAVAFFASSLAVPYITGIVLLASTDVAWALFAFSSLLGAVPLFTLVAVAGLVAVVIVVLIVGVDEARKVVFGFPRSIRLGVLDRQFERMALYVRFQHHHPMLREPQPEDTEEINRKELEEHGGS